MSFVIAAPEMVQAAAADLASIGSLLNESHAIAAAPTAAALAPIALLTLVFPEGGSQPFVASAFYPALAGVVASNAVVMGNALR